MKEYVRSEYFKYIQFGKKELKDIWEIIADDNSYDSTISVTVDMLNIKEKSIDALLAHKQIPDTLGKYQITSYNHSSGKAIHLNALPKVHLHLWISGSDEVWVRGKFQQIEEFMNSKFDQFDEKQKLAEKNELPTVIPIALVKEDENPKLIGMLKSPITKRNIKRVFVVHGHDEEMKHAVARVLRSLDLEPIILKEKPDNNKTLIEKLEQYSDVDFTVVLLSPDDIAYNKEEPGMIEKFRARQNVILELGYFLGKLGRQCVFVLYRESDNFELPSDYFGVLYTKYDESEAWKLKMAKEIKTIDPKIDLNKL